MICTFCGRPRFMFPASSSLNTVRTRRGPRRPRAGHLDLPHRQLPPAVMIVIGPGERHRDAVHPPVKEHLQSAGLHRVAQFLRPRRASPARDHLGDPAPCLQLRVRETANLDGLGRSPVRTMELDLSCRYQSGSGRIERHVRIHT